MKNLENNKIIAEFMGFKINTNTGIEVLYNAKTCEVLDLNKLKYHFDWNELMEVVEKIESLDFNFNITSGDATALINHGAIYQTLIYRIDGTKKIEAVYNTCVEFIKWYNKQKQTQKK